MWGRVLMRYRIWLATCVFLAGTLPCWAGSSCKVGIVFDRAPRPVRDFSKLLSKAEAGDSDAQFQVGLAYASGIGTIQDVAEAVRWYRKAADHGNPAAQNNLGSMYLRGLGVEQSDHDAIRWFTRAAVEGFPAAQNNLGLMYARGRGVPQNDTTGSCMVPKGNGSALRSG
jgi:Sel1 repeat-containing protein